MAGVASPFGPPSERRPSSSLAVGADPSALGVERLRQLASLLAALGAATRLDALHQELTSALAVLFPEDSVRLCLADDASYRCTKLGGTGSDGIFPTGYGIAGQVLRTGEPAFARIPAEAPYRGRGETAGGSMMAVPLRISERVYGAIELASARADHFDHVDVQIASIVGGQFSLTRELILSRQELELTRARAEENQRRFLELQEQLLELAHTDELTGLFNKRRLMEQLEGEVARARRYREALSCLMLDLDNFKQVNDSFGHPAGDEVLRQLGVLLRRSVRVTDFVARYGGEEFALLLPRTDRAGATRVGEALRAALESHPFPVGSSTVSITISVGIATRTTFDEPDVMQLVQLADDALYRAKRAGRNRVCIDSREAAES
jgi:diguanylate cyclase (GGDEF)-like protein